MKIVITGATGFIGNHVIQYLLHQDVNLYVTSSDIEKARQQHWFSKVNYLAFSIGDEFDEESTLFFQDADIVIHLAWSGLTDFKSENHTQIYLAQQQKFISQLTQLNIHRLVNIGTCLEYGLQEGELTEDMPVFPIVNYAIAKNDLRLFTEQIARQFEYGTCWIRLFYMYGQGQSKKSFIPQLHQAILEQKSSFDMSDGEQERDYLPVEKVSEYIVRIAFDQTAQGIFNCSSGKPIKIRTLAEDYIQKMGAKIKLNLGVYSYPDYEPVRFWGNNDKLKKIIDDEV